MHWVRILPIAILLLALLTTGLAVVLQLALPQLASHCSPAEPCATSLAQLFSIMRFSEFAAPISWAGVGSLWVWRGYTKSKWTQLGYDRDAFKFMTQMRGAATRLKLLESLDSPMDRLQLARRLGLDWKAIDRQTQILCRYGLIREEQAYGKVRIYSLSENGRIMLKLIKDLGAQNQQQQESLQR